MLFRKFDISHYGVSFIEDMFMDIPPTSILVSGCCYAFDKNFDDWLQQRKLRWWWLKLASKLKKNLCVLLFLIVHSAFGNQFCFSTWRGKGRVGHVKLESVAMHTKTLISRERLGIIQCLKLLTSFSKYCDRINWRQLRLSSTAILYIQTLRVFSRESAFQVDSNWHRNGILNIFLCSGHCGTLSSKNRPRNSKER